MHGAASLPGLAPVATLVVLLEVAAGTTAAAYAVDLLGRVGRGFVGTTALVCAAVMGVELAITALLPGDTALLGAPLASNAVASLAHWSLGFAGALLGYLK